MNDYDLYESDFREFVRQGILECYGDHPGNGLEELMKKVDEMEFYRECYEIRYERFPLSEVMSG